MQPKPTRRIFFNWSLGAAASAGIARGQQATAAAAAAAAGDQPQTPSVVHEPIYPYNKRSVVSLIPGPNRRKIAHDSLEAIEREVMAGVKRKKYIVIKPNNVSTQNQLASTHADTLRGIIDFFVERTKLPIVIAESSAGDTKTGYNNFGYTKIPADYTGRQIDLIDLNEEAKYEVIPLLTEHLHVQPVRLAARLLDPDAYIVCAAILKTHNTVIATLSVKNMTLGAPLHQPPKETTRWNDKRKYHGGVRQTHYNMFLTAQKMKPFWGATVVDGYEGMEGNGPGSGTPVESRVVIASTDYIAADRVAVEAMGINPAWVGYLNYCAQVGLGNYDLAKIDILGAKIPEIKKSYRLHKDIERELEWMGPMNELPPKLG